MSVSRQRFFADPAVIASLDAYADSALDHLEAGGNAEQLPDLPEFLRARGISEIPDGPIEVHHSVGDPDHVMRPMCPDGSDGCVPKCRTVDGRLQCVWVCHCL